MSAVVGMKTVSLRIVEIACMLINHRKKSADGIEINDWYCPDIARLFHGFYIFVNIFPALVRVIL